VKFETLKTWQSTAHNIRFYKIGARRNINRHFCITRQHLVATFSIVISGKRENPFSKQVQWLGGRISNTPTS
jgi:hypothetical protein